MGPSGRTGISELFKLPHQAWVRSRFAIITLAVLVLILYWTLYPFEFHAAGSAGGPWHKLFSTFRTRGERDDIVANILLFVPLGFFLMLSLPRPRWWDAAVATAGAALLSTTIELLQFYDEGRQTTLSDVYSNATGACLGAAVGVLCYRKLKTAAAAGSGRGVFEVLLLACWLGYRLYPYDIVLNFRKFRHGVQPLIDLRTLPDFTWLSHFAVWLAVALLVETVAGSATLRWVFAVVVVPGMLAARSLIWPIRLAPEDVAAGALAALVWTIVLWRVSSRAKIVAVLFTGAIVFDGLQPLRLYSESRASVWVPFALLLTGQANVGVFLEKAFLCGGLVWTAVRAGCSWKTATIAGGALVFVLGLAQVYVSGRPAGSTDLAILLMASATMRLLPGGPAGRVEKKAPQP